MITRATEAGFSVRTAIQAWPAHRPLIVLGAVETDEGPLGDLASTRARWTILTQPAATFRVRLVDGQPRSEWIDPATGASLPPPVAFTHNPMEDLAAVLRAHRRHAHPGMLPFHGGWIGYLSYDLGRFIEPASSRGVHRTAEGGGDPFFDRAWPLIELHHCLGAYIVDQALGLHVPVGDTSGLPRPDELTSPRPAAVLPPTFEFRSAAGRDGFENSVRRAIEYIRAGDVFQVNLAHRLSAPFGGSTRAAYLNLCGPASPWYGAYLELPAEGERRRAVLSLSPELLLEIDPISGTVETRPMKGTRPGAASPADLYRSEKDLAELNMIIDLMRNDLGRICAFGSIDVAEARSIERHGRGPGAVYQAVATVRGRLRDDCRLAEGSPDIPRVLSAVFPGGSVTGAPEIRAMQIIEELEPVARGPYCGSIGFISDCGRAMFNVAIRTALVSGETEAGVDQIGGGVIDYSVGAGIVADSDPKAEWKETLDKAGVLQGLSPLPPARVP